MACLQRALPARRAHDYRARLHRSTPLRGPLAVAAAQHNGPVVLHCFENCSGSPAFQSFQEGLYHIMEVARSNDHFETALLHETINDGDEEKTGDFSYAAVMLYSPPPGALFGDYDDFQTSVEFGVAEPNHQAIMTEVATLPDGVDSPLASGGAAATPETSVVALAVYDQAWTGAAALALAEQFAALPGAATTSLYKRDAAATGDGRVQCCVRAEFPGPLDADAVNSLEVAMQTAAGSADGLMHASLYQVLFNIPKAGAPVGILAAHKATELAKARGIDPEKLE